MPNASWTNIVAVVADPFAREQLAARKAARIAARTGARLTLFNAFMIPQPLTAVPMDSSEQIITAAIRQRRERLTKLAASLRAAGAPPIRVAVEWDFPTHEAIVRHVLAVKPDLVIAESHRHGRIARWLLANTDWELIRACPAPLWFVRSAAVPRRLRVLVAVDPRHVHAKPARLDDRLLAAARTLDDEIGAQISIAHAYEAPVGGDASTAIKPLRRPLSPDRAPTFAREVRKGVERLADRYGIEPEQRFIQQGSAADVLATLTKQRNVDVLVMGAVSRSRIERPVIGNTAERVIDHVDCDVFIVKPAGFKTSVRRSRGRRHPAS